jgi:hypothetical protein
MSYMRGIQCHYCSIEVFSTSHNVFYIQTSFYVIVPKESNKSNIIKGPDDRALSSIPINEVSPMESSNVRTTSYTYSRKVKCDKCGIIVDGQRKLRKHKKEYHSY